MKHGRAGVWGIVYACGALFVVLLGLVAFQPAPRTYSFVKADHPIDMWGNGGDKWSYYSIGEGTTSELAEVVRKDLLSKGFSEDTTKKPWFRFVKGDSEVVVCNHNEFAVNSSPFSGKLMKTDAKADEARLKAEFPDGKIPNMVWPCILVKNGPGTNESIILFEMKKLLHGW